MRREKRNVAVELNKKHVFPRAATGGGAAAAGGVPRGAGVAALHPLPPDLHHAHDRRARQRTPPGPRPAQCGGTAAKLTCLDCLHASMHLNISNMCI